MKTSEFLRAAKDLIDTPEKWWSDNGNDGDACACMAIWRVRDAAGLAGFASNPADFALARCAGYDGPETPWNVSDARACVYRYNDAEGTTHADVMALFDRAIAAEEIRELQAAFDVPSPSRSVRTEVPA